MTHTQRPEGGQGKLPCSSPFLLLVLFLLSSPFSSFSSIVFFFRLGIIHVLLVPFISLSSIGVFTLYFQFQRGKLTISCRANYRAAGGTLKPCGSKIFPFYVFAYIFYIRGESLKGEKKSTICCSHKKLIRVTER